MAWVPEQQRDAEAETERWVAIAIGLALVWWVDGRRNCPPTAALFARLSCLHTPGMPDCLNSKQRPWADSRWDPSASADGNAQPKVSSISPANPQ